MCEENLVKLSRSRDINATSKGQPGNQHDNVDTSNLQSDETERFPSNYPELHGSYAGISVSSAKKKMARIMNGVMTVPGSRCRMPKAIRERRLRAKWKRVVRSVASIIVVIAASI